MKKNKGISFALALMTCACLTGCGDKNESSTPVNSDTDNSSNSVSAPESDNDTASSSDVVMEPVIVNVTDIMTGTEMGYAFNYSSTYGNAFGITYTYGSTDGSAIDNMLVTVTPGGMTIDEALATDWCSDIDKAELQEVELSGIPSWVSTPEGAAALVEAHEGIDFGDFWAESRIPVLTAAGVSEEDAAAQAAEALDALGLGSAE